MRIHVFKDRTLAGALRQVRAAHGDDAIVLDTNEGPDGATVRVGVEPPEAPAAKPTSESRTPDAEPTVGEAPKGPVPMALSSATDQVAEALAWHGAPSLVTRSLLLSVEADSGADAETALARALARVFRFGRPDALETPLALVGPPGAGKTATLAKLAAARYMAGTPVAIVNADLETAGACERIAAFANALGVSPRSAQSAKDIEAEIEDAGPNAATFVDTSGRAPADSDDVEELAREVEAVGAAALTLSAAIAPAEAAELAECFAAAGAEMLIMTQLDIARRVGALLAAADAGDLVIAGVSLGRKVGDGLQPLTPESLARLILAPPSKIVRPVRTRRPARQTAAKTQSKTDAPASTPDSLHGAVA